MQTKWIGAEKGKKVHLGPLTGKRKGLIDPRGAFLWNAKAQSEWRCRKTVEKGGGHLQHQKKKENTAKGRKGAPSLQRPELSSWVVRRKGEPFANPRQGGKGNYPFLAVQRG